MALIQRKALATSAESTRGAISTYYIALFVFLGYTEFAMSLEEHLFGSSALAKNVPEVVRSALRAPIAVTTPHGTVSMLSRERLQHLTRRARMVEDVLRAMTAAHAHAPAASFPPTLRWMRLLPDAEIPVLADEVMTILDSIDDGRADLDELEDTLHEWAETAIHVADPAIGAAIRDGGR